MDVQIHEEDCSVVVTSQGERVKTASQLLYRIRRELQKQGYDVIKKRMWKDGHMVSDSEHYLRERKWRFVIWHPNYMVENLAGEFNRNGIVILQYENWSEEKR